MGYNTGNNGGGKLVAFKLKTKDVEKPYFEGKTKVGEKWEVIEDKPTNIEGNLVKVVLDTGEFDGSEYDIVNLYLQDFEGTGETYLLDLRLNFTTRSLFNSLLSLEKFDNLKISTYLTKLNDQGKSYPAITLRAGDEKVPWKYSKNETPATKTVTVNKKKQTDTADLDAFYVAKLTEFAEVVNSTPKTPITKKVVAEKAVDVSS